jgi:uncharacterized protein (DUF433 family)
VSKTMSLRLSTEQLAAVERWGRYHNQRSVSATLQMLLEEKLRQERFPGIVFRGTAAGRQAFLEGTRIAVWQLIQLLRASGENSADVAAHLQLPEDRVRLAAAYAEEHSDEIDAVLADYDAITFQDLRLILPQIESSVAPSDAVCTPDSPQ